MIVGAEGNSRRFESAAVMALEDAGHQERRRMHTEIGRKIGDTNLPMAVFFSPRRCRKRGAFMLEPETRGAKMLCRGGTPGDKLKRGYDGPAGLESLQHRGFFGLKIAPIATLQAALQKIAWRIRIIGVEPQDLLVIGHRVFEAPKENEQPAPIAQRPDIIGFDGQGLG